MIERPSAKPGIVNTPETARSDESSSRNQTVEQRPASERAPVAATRPLSPTSDSFDTKVGEPASPMNQARVDRGLDKTEGKPVGPRTKSTVEPLLVGAKQVQVERGDDWSQALARHYGQELTPEMVRLVAAANGQKNPTHSPPSIIAAPTLEQLYYAQHPGEREVGRAIIRESSFVIIPPGESVQDVIRSHYDVEDEQVVKVLTEAALYLNDASRYAAPPGVMALPSIDGLNNLIMRMKREIDATQKRRDAVDEIAIL
ncbi:MAG: hypothetical protein VX834_10195, partial [Myxococcota bacterium]|nr:hypothetical protein [Myxococcota bacterium]